ncbi:MAG: TolC family protein [Endomicrobiaceae bacterium]|nr:TolC family protein [Endomicrobiaceae bacterium]
MNIRFLFVIAACFFVSVSSAYADQFLDACLKIATARDLKISVAQEQVELAQTRVTSSIRSFFPQLMLQRRFSKGKTKFKVVSGSDEEEYNSEELGIRAVQPIYEGGGSTGGYKYNRLMMDASKYNYTKSKEELYSKVKMAYYEYLTLKVEYLALTKAFEKVERLYLKTQVEYKARAISELDLMESKNFRDKVSNLLNASRINLEFATKKLVEIVGVYGLEDIPATVSAELPTDVPEISFTLQDCVSFVQTNNLDVKIAKIQIEMADTKIKINRAKVLPKLYLDGFYGRSGEAFTTVPLELTTSWNVSAKLSWGLWGNSLNASYSTDKTEPTTIIDASKRVETTTFDVQLSILDDLQYFVDAKESSIGKKQTISELIDILKNSRLTVEKTYNEYAISLNNAKTLRQEITLKERKLALMEKRNNLYEVPTVSLMEESWQYAEAISSFARASYTNHASVTELERLTLMSLR